MIYEMGDIGSASVRTEEHTVIRSGNVKGATIGEAMDNARLIACAPELLECLKELVEKGSWSNGDPQTKRAKAVIAKAEGKPPVDPDAL
jgi:hypothetical protein